MTMLSYPQGWSAGSQVHGRAFGPASNAWGVNLHNGNCNLNNQSNRNSVRAVLAGECHESVSFRSLFAAWRDASRGKKPSADHFRFNLRRSENLLELQSELNTHTWRPGAPTCFIQPDPKAREIHAPPFRDRIVHHWLVPLLEAIYESVFIHDSYGSRINKGTHAAVRRARDFIREIASGQGGGWYLQLDVKNFFPSIHRPTLYGLLKARMERCRVPDVVRRAVHALLNNPISRTGVIRAYSDAERAAVPEHKRLENAPPGCGIAIGNLSSQFLARVYLDPLDQFIKHTLKVKRYLRYVDDLVLFHESREQLLAWLAQIEVFLQDRLKLELKAEKKLKPLTSGLDFLGYVIWPTHIVVRRRVVDHARRKLRAWARHRVQPDSITATPAEFRALRSTWASYAGHLAHAASSRLFERFYREFPWLRAALLRKHFELAEEGMTISVTRGCVQ